MTRRRRSVALTVLLTGALSGPAWADAGTTYTFSRLVNPPASSNQQGLAYADGVHYIGFDIASGRGQIVGYNSAGAVVEDSGPLTLGHAAEVSFRQADGNLYVATGGGTNPTFVNVVNMRLSTPAIIKRLDFSALGNNGLVAVDNERDRLLVFTGKNTAGQWVFTWSDFAGNTTPGFVLTDAGIPQGLEIVNDQILYYASAPDRSANTIRVLDLTGATAYRIPVPVALEGQGLSTDLATNQVHVGFRDNTRIDRMSPVLTAPVGINLLSNPNAESGTGATDSATARPLPSWTTSGMTALTYTAGGGYPTASSPGPAARGSVFFAGGTSAIGTMTQRIALSGLSTADVDASGLRYTLRGWLGGYLTQEDNNKVVATFLDGNGTVVGSGQIGPVTATDRAGVTGLLERSRSATLPPGTRSISVTVTGTRVSGTNLDAYADALSLQLTRQ